MEEEKDTSIIHFHKCTEPGFQEYTEPSVRCQECTETGFQEYTEPSVHFQECTETGSRSTLNRLPVARSALKPVSRSTLNHLAVSRSALKPVSRSTLNHLPLSRSALKWVSAAGKQHQQHRHAAPLQQVTFTLPPHHIDKDSTSWRHIQPEGRTTHRIVPRTAELHSPPSTPLHPHPSQGILATSTAGAVTVDT